MIKSRYADASNGVDLMIEIKPSGMMGKEQAMMELGIDEEVPGTLLSVRYCKLVLFPR